MRRQGAIVLAGDATNPDVLRAARIQRAHNLICLLGDDRENLQVAYQSYRLCDLSRKGRLTCLLHLASTDLLELIKTSELAGEARAPFELETFNSYARTARLLLQDDLGWREAAAPQEIASHLLVIGLGRLGESLVMQEPATNGTCCGGRAGCASRWWIEPLEKTRTLLLKQPQLDRVCELVPLQTDLSAAGALQNALAGGHPPAPIQRSYIWLGDPVLSLQVLFRSPSRSSGLHIFG